TLYRIAKNMINSETICLGCYTFQKMHTSLKKQKWINQNEINQKSNPKHGLIATFWRSAALCDIHTANI
ncbi:hypothetical protein ACTHQ2_22925, partial [Bacillus subtilis]|uniref:hypothetical protein n=1 Tax=Bacillus subtilis TaxID=1423 RepID=UPI003F7C4E57